MFRLQKYKRLSRGKKQFELLSVIPSQPSQHVLPFYLWFFIFFFFFNQSLKAYLWETEFDKFKFPPQPKQLFHILNHPRWKTLSFIKTSEMVLEASTNYNKQIIRDLRRSSLSLHPLFDDPNRTHSALMSPTVSVLYTWFVITHGAMLLLAVPVYLLDDCCTSLCTLW